MNLALLIAAGLTAFGAFWHGVGGHRGIVARLDASRLAPAFGDSDVTLRFLRAAWHLFTAYLLVTAMVLALIGVVPHPATVAVARVVAFHFVAFLLVYVAVVA